MFSVTEIYIKNKVEKKKSITYSSDTEIMRLSKYGLIGLSISISSVFEGQKINNVRYVDIDNTHDMVSNILLKSSTNIFQQQNPQIVFVNSIVFYHDKIEISYVLQLFCLKKFK